MDYNSQKFPGSLATEFWELYPPPKKKKQAQTSIPLFAELDSEAWRVSSLKEMVSVPIGNLLPGMEMANAFLGGCRGAFLPTVSRVLMASFQQNTNKLFDS